MARALPAGTRPASLRRTSASGIARAFVHTEVESSPNDDGINRLPIPRHPPHPRRRPPNNTACCSGSGSRSGRSSPSTGSSRSRGCMRRRLRCSAFRSFRRPGVGRSSSCSAKCPGRTFRDRSSLPGSGDRAPRSRRGCIGRRSACTRPTSRKNLRRRRASSRSQRRSSSSVTKRSCTHRRRTTKERSTAHSSHHPHRITFIATSSPIRAITAPPPSHPRARRRAAASSAPCPHGSTTRSVRRSNAARRSSCRNNV